MTNVQAQQLMNALINLAAATQELSNIVDETGYELSVARPSYVADVEDFTYEVTSWVHEEIEEINEIKDNTDTGVNSIV